MILKLARELYRPRMSRFGEWPDAERWSRIMMAPMWFIIAIYGGPVIMWWGRLPWWMRTWGIIATLMALYILWIRRSARLYLVDRGRGNVA